MDGDLKGFLLDEVEMNRGLSVALFVSKNNSKNVRQRIFPFKNYSKAL